MLTDRQKASEFKRLYKLAENHPSAYHVTMSGYENAAQTDGVEFESEEFFRVAYDSICWTADFEEHRKWLIANGFEY